MRLYQPDAIGGHIRRPDSLVSLLAFNDRVTLFAVVSRSVPIIVGKNIDLRPAIRPIDQQPIARSFNGGKNVFETLLEQRA